MTCLFFPQSCKVGLFNYFCSLRTKKQRLSALTFFLMLKAQYRYNPQTLTYEKVQIGYKKRLLRIFSFLVSALVFGAVILIFAYTYIDSPKEKRLKREIEQLTLQYEFLNKKFDQFAIVLEDLQYRDDNIYRVIFEAEPIPANIRKAGFGGVNRYRNLEGYSQSEIIIETNKKLDRIAKQMYIQSKSFDEVVELVKQKEEMLASIPAIQPISNKDLTRVASGFGNRVDPVYKIHKFHTGMDFTASTGTDIYATGNGTVVVVERALIGYGNHIVIDHGFGYNTLYAHLSKILVKPGAHVKRGDVIGYVGNTGKSVGPHLHYEVVKNDVKINPVNFFFSDLRPEEYERMIQISSASNQSFD